MAAAAASAASASGSGAGAGAGKSKVIIRETARAGYIDVDDEYDAKELLENSKSAWRPGSASRDASLSASMEYGGGASGGKVIYIKRRDVPLTAPAPWSHRAFRDKLTEDLKLLGFPKGDTRGYCVHVVVIDCDDPKAERLQLTREDTLVYADAVLVFAWNKQKGRLTRWACHPPWKLQKHLVEHVYSDALKSKYPPPTSLFDCFEDEIEHLQLEMYSRDRVTVSTVTAEPSTFDGIRLPIFEPGP